EDDHAAIVEPAVGIFDVLDKDANRLADFGLLGIFRLPLVAGDHSLALVTDVDEDEFVVDADDFAFNDLIDVDVGAAQPTHVIGGQFANGVGPVFLRNVELTNKIAVNHRKKWAEQRLATDQARPPLPKRGESPAPWR